MLYVLSFLSVLSAESGFWLDNDRGIDAYHVSDVINVMHLTVCVNGDVLKSIATVGYCYVASIGQSGRIVFCNWWDPLFFYGWTMLNRLYHSLILCTLLHVYHSIRIKCILCYLCVFSARNRHVILLRWEMSSSMMSKYRPVSDRSFLPNVASTWYHSNIIF